MRAGESSQLQAYLDTFVTASDGDDTVSPSPTVILMRYLRAVVGSLIHWIVREILNGFSRDIVHVMKSLAALGVATTSSSISTPNSQTKFLANSSNQASDIFRRFVLFFILMSCCRAKLVSDSSGFIGYVFSVMVSVLFRMSVVLTTAPIIIGVSLDRLISSMLKQVNQTESSTCYVIGWIKRLQLTSLGRQITHPMPPIAKIEESTRDVYGDIILCCPAVRKALHSALLTLQDNLYTSVQAFTDVSKSVTNSAPTITGDRNIHSISQLQLLSSSIFKLHIPSCYQSILIHLDSYASPVGTEFMDFKEDRSHFIRLLQLPIFLIDIKQAVHQLQSKLNLICREVSLVYDESDRSCFLPFPLRDFVLPCFVGGTNSTPSSTMGIGSDSQLPGSSGYLSETSSKDADAVVMGSSAEISTAYTSFRLQLLKAKHEAEGVLNRLWLCEKELSSAEASRLLFSPPLNIPGLDKFAESSSKECSEALSPESERLAIKRLYSALNCLNGVSITETSPTEIDCSKQQASQALPMQLEILIAMFSRSQSSVVTSTTHRHPINGVRTDRSDVSSEPSASGNDPLQCSGVQSNGTIFESMNAMTDKGSDTVTEADPCGVRVVDVYAATVLTVPPTVTTRVTVPANANIVSDINNANRLLSELQKHIHMLDLRGRTVERVKNTDSDDFNGSDVLHPTVSKTPAEEETAENEKDVVCDSDCPQDLGPPPCSCPPSGLEEPSCDPISISLNHDFKNYGAELLDLFKVARMGETTDFSFSRDDDDCFVDDDSYVEVEVETNAAVL